MTPAAHGGKTKPRGTRQPAATGRPTRLYPNAHMKLILMRLNVVRLRSIAVHTSHRLLRTSTMSAASMAASVPAPERQS